MKKLFILILLISIINNSFAMVYCDKYFEENKAIPFIGVELLNAKEIHKSRTSNILEYSGEGKCLYFAPHHYSYIVDNIAIYVERTPVKNLNHWEVLGDKVSCDHYHRGIDDYNNPKVCPMYLRE